MQEIAIIKIRTETLRMLIDSDAITSDDYELKIVDVEGYDYSKNPIWVEQKKVSDKEFKKLKAIEFEIRHNTKK